MEVLILVFHLSALVVIVVEMSTTDGTADNSILMGTSTAAGTTDADAPTTAFFVFEPDVNNTNPKIYISHLDTPFGSYSTRATVDFATFTINALENQLLSNYTLEIDYVELVSLTVI